MMELEELIREYEEDVALEMYHEMVDYIDNHGADITGRNVDYTLMEVISTVRASAYMPEETMLALRGYEIVVETQMGLGISFCMGQFWIGGKLILIRYEEEIENYLVHFINNILPGGLALWKEKMENVDMDLLKREKIRNILEKRVPDSDRPGGEGSGIQTLFQGQWHRTAGLSRRQVSYVQ